MQPETLRSLKESLNQMQGPVPELMELNIKTFQNLSFIKPEEWSHLKNPQDIFDKSLRIFVHNGHKMLDYFQHATEIFEKNWFLNSDQALKNFQQRIAPFKQTMRKNPLVASTLKGKQNEKWKKSH